MRLVLLGRRKNITFELCIPCWMWIFYADGAGRVVAEDWGGLIDVMPTMNKVLWIS